MIAADIISAARRAGYKVCRGETTFVVRDDDGGNIHWTCPPAGVLVFAVFGRYAALTVASSQKDEKRMMRKIEEATA
jgi:hypothetical protein